MSCVLCLIHILIFDDLHLDKDDGNGLFAKYHFDGFNYVLI